MHHLKAAGMIVAAVLLIPFVWDGFDEVANIVRCTSAAIEVGRCAPHDAGAWLAPWSDYGSGARFLLNFLPFSALLPFASILCALGLAARYWLDTDYESDIS